MDLYITKNETKQEKNIVLDDLILTKDSKTTAGSNMLKSYESLFEAQVVTILKDNGYNISGKANTGEMGIDLIGETSAFGACVDENGNLVYAPAQIIKTQNVDAAVVLDVNSAPQRGASLQDLVYLKPTYATVSRFGTIPCVCSAETVSVMAKSADKVEEVLSKIQAHDDKDGTSLAETDAKTLEKETSKILKIAVIKDMKDTVDEDSKKVLDDFIKKVNEKGIKTDVIEAKELMYARPAWNILMSAELCNNVSKYDGVKYGHRSENYTNIDELYTNSRSEAFGYLLKSAILYGSDALGEDNYMKIYDKALRIRRVVNDCIENILKSYDAILLPVCSKREYKKEDVEKNEHIVYDETKYTAPAQMTGFPVLVTNKVQVVGKKLGEKALLELAKSLKEEAGA